MFKEKYLICKQGKAGKGKSEGPSKPPEREKLKEESEEQPVEAKVPEPIVEKTWKQIMRFSGEGMKTTDTFYISGAKWRVKWNVRPSSLEMPTIIFQIFVNRSNGELVLLTANVITQGSDYSVIHEKGTFFLEVNSGLAKWGIIIEEWK